MQIHVVSLSTKLKFHFYLPVCTKTPNSLARAEVNHAPGSYVYTMGIWYRQILRWQTVQLVNSSRRYVSTRPV